VLDGAGYHRSSVVVEKAKELNIKLHYYIDGGPLQIKSPIE
jgi:hypothetical protein